jgi:hypothetical protein
MKQILLFITRVCLGVLPQCPKANNRLLILDSVAASPIETAALLQAQEMASKMLP